MDHAKQHFVNIMSKYVPEDSVMWCVNLIYKYGTKIRITKSRNSKLGDYRWPQLGEGHVISVNHDLNPYAFLITFTHEFAHLICWEKHKNKVNPHGNEWQREFSVLLKELTEMHIFPDDIKKVLLHRGDTLKASSCSDPLLMKALRKYDPHKGTNLLHELPENVLFVLKNGEVFQKGEKRRTRYKCLHIQSKKFYLVSGVAEVKLVNPQNN